MKENPTILIATGLYPPEMGGPATYSIVLEKELPSRGFEVSILPFSTVRNGPKLIRHISYFFKVLKMGRNCEIIYALDPVSVGLPAMLASKILGKRFMLRVAGDYAWEQGVQRFDVRDVLDDFYKHKYGFAVQFLKWVESAVATSADDIVVPSQYLKRIVMEWGIESQKIKVVYNAFDLPEIEDSKEKIRSDLKLSGEIILSIGRLVPWKGFDTLIEVFAEYKKENKDSTLLIIGSDGPDEARLQEIINSFGLSESVRLLGKFEKKYLSRYIRAADLFILNTSYEGFSHQLLEVMAIGTPIITTSVGGNIELIKDKENGILIPYNEKRLLKESMDFMRLNKKEVERYCSNAKNYVRKFSTEHMIDGLISAIRK